MNNQNQCVPCLQHDEIKAICEKILVLQEEAIREESDEFCDRDFLGNQEFGKEKINTRPVMLFTDDDKAWHCPVNRDEDDCNDRERELTCVFRVEKVVNGTATLRALKEKHHDEMGSEREEKCHKERFESTNSFITIKFANIAALRCLRDTFVNICID